VKVKELPDTAVPRCPKCNGRHYVCGARTDAGVDWDCFCHRCSIRFDVDTAEWEPGNQ